MSGFYIGVGGKAQKTKGCYIGVNDVARKIKKIYLGDENGLAKEVYSSGKKLSEYTVGSTVYLLENGSPVEYLIVHKGLPDKTLYDNSCDGIWLLRKDIITTMPFGSTNNNYQNSSINTYLNDEFLNRFNNKSIIKQVKIPYITGNNSNDLSTKIFLLSCYEVGLTTAIHEYIPVDGAKLDYFEIGDTANGTDSKKRIAYLSGSSTSWWLRSATNGISTMASYIGINGRYGYSEYTMQRGVRPVLILPHGATIDPNTNTIIG